MNITLIGMPGSGKSYIGKKLANDLKYQLIDLDGITEMKHGMPLSVILEEIGEEKFLAEQEIEAIQETSSIDKAIISPGGSIIYSADAMKHLQSISTIIYLESDFITIKKRINNLPRGIVGLGTKTLLELYNERSALYRKWAYYTVNAQLDADTVVRTIKAQLQQ
jgi:shikimate kinase